MLSRKVDVLPHNQLCASRKSRTLSVTLRSWIRQAAGLRAGSTSESSIPSVPANIPNQKSPQGTQLKYGTGEGRSDNLSSIPSDRNDLAVNLTTQPATGRFILFGVHGGRRTLELAQIDVANHQDDNKLFHDLRKHYRELRGFWRYWLSIWQFKHCSFVKVGLLDLPLSLY